MSNIWKERDGPHKRIWIGSESFIIGSEQRIPYYEFTPALYPELFQGFVPWNLLKVLEEVP